MTATQTTECTFPQPSPLPDVTIRLSMSLEVDADSSGGFGIGPVSEGLLPEEWSFEIFEYVIPAVHAALAVDDFPSPDSGVGFVVTQLTIHPSIEATTSEDDVHRICKMVYSVVWGTTLSLWNGWNAASLPVEIEATRHSPSLWERAQSTRESVGYAVRDE